MNAQVGRAVNALQDNLKPAKTEHSKECFANPVSNEGIELERSFTCFPKLPAELRLKIWKEALPGPRVIRIKLKFEPREPFIFGQKRKPQVGRFVASRPPPVGLRVCRESRIEALKDYQIGFPTKTSPAQTYLNYDQDTLVLDTLGAYFPHAGRTNRSATRKRKPVILHREFSRIRYLAIDERFLWTVDRVLTQSSFPCLEVISIIVFDKSNSSLMRGIHELERRERPQQPERMGPSLLWIDTWMAAMENLATQATADHPAPEIRFVNLVRGTGQKSTADKKDGVESTTPQLAQNGLSQTHLNINETLENQDATDGMEEVLHG